VPRPTHRLDLCIVPAEPDHPVLPDVARALAGAWRAAPPAGARHVRVDLPGEATLYANQLGGFRVACPVGGESIVPAFGRAMGAWRRGGPRSLSCPACGDSHALEALAFTPPAAFAQGGVVLGDVETSQLEDGALETAARVLGCAVRVVGRRVS